MKFLQKMFWFNFIQFTVGYFNKYERFCNFKQTSWNYKTFISAFLTLLKFINNSVNETQWIISFHKLFFYQRDFFIKVSEPWQLSLIVFHLKCFAVLVIHFEQFWKTSVSIKFLLNGFGLFQKKKNARWKEQGHEISRNKEIACWNSSSQRSVLKKVEFPGAVRKKPCGISMGLGF